jgi:hypothetical protein
MLRRRGIRISGSTRLNEGGGGVWRGEDGKTEKPEKGGRKCVQDAVRPS